MKEDKPLSEKIGEWVGGDYLLTAGIWRNLFGSESYEIGIRHKTTGEFHLFQGDWDYQSVQEVANAIGHVLSEETYTPEWCMEHFK